MLAPSVSENTAKYSDAHDTNEPAHRFTDVQDRFAETVFDGRFRIIGFGGAIRGTKTWGGLGIIITLCRIFPHSRWAVVRKDLPTLRRNLVPSFNKLRERCNGFVGEINQGTWTATCSNGSEIVFFSESIDGDPDLDRWKGLEVNGFLLEEADELREASYVKAIERAGAWIVPNGEQPPPYILCTFNPTGGWPKRIFYEPWRNGTMAPPYAFIPATIADNPFAPASYLESLKSMPDQDYKRFVEGDWEVLTGRFYDTIDTRVHLIDRSLLPARLPDWWEFWAGFDWGYAHWSVMGAFARDSHGTMFLLDSHWVRRAQDADQARSFNLTLEPRCLRTVYAGGDCWSSVRARGGSGVTTAEIFAAHEIYLIPADTDRVNGGRAVRRAFAFKRDESGKITDRPILYVVKTPGNDRVIAQLAETMPDENDVNKPAKVDCDAQGRGGDDGENMMRYGLSTHIHIPTNDGIALPFGEDTDRTRIIGGKAITQPGNTDDPIWKKFEHEHKQSTQRKRVKTIEL